MRPRLKGGVLVAKSGNTGKLRVTESDPKRVPLRNRKTQVKVVTIDGDKRKQAYAQGRGYFFTQFSDSMQDISVSRKSTRLGYCIPTLDSIEQSEALKTVRFIRKARGRELTGHIRAIL